MLDDEEDEEVLSCNVLAPLDSSVDKEDKGALSPNPLAPLESAAVDVDALSIIKSLLQFGEQKYN